jgi:hypothetical protein
MNKPESNTKTRKKNEKLSSTKILKLEKCMIRNNLKLTKTDISLAARRSRIPINRALFHFQCLTRELSDNKINDNKAMTKRIKEIAKRIKKIFKRMSKN